MGEPWLMLSALGTSAMHDGAELPGEDSHAPALLPVCLPPRVTEEKAKGKQCK